jgi:hypothetical protein
MGPMGKLWHYLQITVAAGMIAALLSLCGDTSAVAVRPLAVATPGSFACKAATAANRVQAPPPLWKLSGRTPSAKEITRANATKPLCPAGRVPSPIAHDVSSSIVVPPITPAKSERLGVSESPTVPPALGGLGCRENGCYWYTANENSKGAIGMEYGTNISEPHVSPFGPAHSIDQLAMGAGPGGNTYTIEAGWDVDPGLFNSSPLPHFFIFINKNKYANGEDCYDCDYTPVEGAKISPGEALEPSSANFTIAVRYFNGAWWVWGGTQWIAYVSENFWGGSFTHAESESNYGEVFDEELGPTSQMGDGQAGSSASATSMTSPTIYITEGEGERPALNAYTNNPTLYSIGDVGSNEREWHFGGPGAPTPPAPSVTTEAATGISWTGAELHGSVNPNGPETRYYFQYGETTAYGSSTSENDAGFGTSGDAEHATITGLKAGTTYHYRIVAKSWAGTSYGSDRTFETMLMPKASMVEWDGTRHVYYRGLNGQLHEWYWNGTAWSQNDWGYPGEVASDPSAIVLANGDIDVYYRATNGQLGQWWYGTKFLTEWNQHNWGYEKEVASDPSAVVLPNGSSDVYYRDSKGQLANWWFGANQNTEWSQQNWGYENEIVGDPSAVSHSNNTIDVYYHSSSGQMGQWWYGTNQSSEWSQHNWGYEKEVASDPSAVVLPNGSTDVYYRSSSGQMGQWWYGTKFLTEWNQHNWGYEKEVAGTPSAVAHSNNTIDVYYRATNAQLGQWWYGTNQSSEWNQHNWGYAGVLGGDPSAGGIASGGEDIYYGGTKLQMWQWWIDGSSWNLSAVGSW